MRPRLQFPELPSHAPIAHFSFDAPDSSVELRGGAEIVPEGGARGGYLRIPADSPGCARLVGTEALAFSNGEFSISFWARTSGEQTGDPVALSNKDWNSGTNAGIAFVAARKVDLSRTSGCTDEERRTGAPGFAVNVGCAAPPFRQDVGVFDPPPGEWCLYMATCGADGILRFYQGHPDGHLYFISDGTTGVVPASGLPFFAGQDGRGRYRHAFAGDIDEIRIWDRAVGAP